jgi:hypothetical protein
MAMVFIVVAVLLWRGSLNIEIRRGLAYALLCTGILMVTATTLNVQYNNQRIENTTEIVTSNYELQQVEIIRMEKVMATAYIGGLTTFSIALALGVLLWLISKRQMVKGIGIGLLLFGMMGLSIKFVSMNRNQHYLEEIKLLNFRDQ